MARSILWAITTAAVMVGCGEPMRPSPLNPKMDPPELAAGQYRFELEWTASSRAPDPSKSEDQLQGSLALDASLTVDALPASAEHHYLQLSLSDVTRFRWAAGDEAGGDPSHAQIGTCTAWVDVIDGPATALLYPQTITPACEHALTHIAVNLDLVPPQGSDTREVLGNYGRVQATYDQLGSSLSRSVHGSASGQTFGGRSALELDAEGRPESLDAVQWSTHSAAETQVDGRSRVVLRRTSVGPTTVNHEPRIQDLRVQDLEPAVNGELARRRQAAAFADGLDPGMMALVISGVDNGAKLAPGFAIRARGLMIANPELAYAVGEQFEAAQSATSRQLVADLLAQADTPEAGNVLRAIIKAEVEDGAEDRSLILQRLAFMHDPGAESMALALELHAQALERDDETVRLASLHVLGKLAKELRGEEPALTGAAMRLLRRASEDPDVDVVKAALAGLGNAASSDDVPRVLQALGNDNEEVRSFAALALRNMPGASVETTLHTLVQDPSPIVRRRAESALRLRGEVQAGGDAGS